MLGNQERPFNPGEIEAQMSTPEPSGGAGEKIEKNDKTPADTQKISLPERELSEDQFIDMVIKNGVEVSSTLSKHNYRLSRRENEYTMQPGDDVNMPFEDGQRVYQFNGELYLIIFSRTLSKNKLPEGRGRYRRGPNRRRIVQTPLSIEKLKEPEIKEQ